MLQSRAAARSAREVWRIYGAHGGGEHPFALETRALLKVLRRSHSHICYSTPHPADRSGADFDAPRRLSVPVLHELEVPRDADFYLCGPTVFMSDLTADRAAWEVAANRIHTEIFGSGPSKTPGVATAALRPPHLPDRLAGSGPLVSFARSGLNVRWDLARQSLLELAEATCRCGGRAAPGCATLARLG